MKSKIYAARSQQEKTHLALKYVADVFMQNPPFEDPKHGVCMEAHDIFKSWLHYRLAPRYTSLWPGCCCCGCSAAPLTTTNIFTLLISTAQQSSLVVTSVNEG